MSYPHNLPPSPPAFADDPGDEISLRDVWNTLRRNRYLIAGVAAVVVGAAALWTHRQRPVYESTTTVRIDDDRARMNPLADLGPLGGPARGVIETEMVVLQSRQIAEAVVDSLALHVQLAEPYAPRSAVLRVLHAPADAAAAVVLLRHRGDGVYEPRLESGEAAAELPAAVRAGEPFSVAGVTLALQPALHEAPPARVRIEIRPHRRVVEEVRTGLRVARPNRDAQVVSVAYRSTDPEIAAAVPNAAARSFIDYKRFIGTGEARSTVRFLREQVATYETQLEQAEARLKAFREEAQVVSLNAEASEQVRRLAELQARRDELRAERESLAKLLARATQPGRAAEEQSPYRQLASYPVFLSNRAIQDLLQSLTRLEDQRAQLLVRRTEDNLDVQGIDRRVQELELQLYQTASNYLESLESQLASLDATLASFGRQLEQIPAREVQFARLSRQQSLLEEIYTLLQTRLKEAEIREAVEPNDVRVIDPALIPDRPVAPRPLRNLALAAVLGLMLGVGAAFGRQALDTKIRSREDAEAVTGGLPVLGMIPRIRMAGTHGGNGNGNGHAPARTIRIPGIIPGVKRVAPQELLGERLVTHRDPRSPSAEAYRALRTSITFANAEKAPQVLVVTSAMPGDGKSTSASNLAITLAQQGVRTLLVDADLRKGLLHRVFGLRQEPGLTHLLLGRTSIEQAVQTVDVGGDGEPLHVLSTGIFPPNPAELLGSERMRSLLEELRARYETIVFDAPPLNLVTDAAVLGKAADATLLVARAGTTDRGALQHAVLQLRHLRAPVGGVVLNDFDASQGGYYYGGYAYYGG